jgi:hypothetical protein
MNISTDIYAGDRIDYMNARRDAIRSRGVAAGGKDHTVVRNARADRERMAGMDAFERVREIAAARFADIRAAAREDFNSFRSGVPAADLVF